MKLVDEGRSCCWSSEPEKHTFIVVDQVPSAADFSVPFAENARQENNSPAIPCGATPKGCPKIASWRLIQ